MFYVKVVEEMKDAQQKLFEWREDFFHGKFNKGPAGETWVTNGGDDAHMFDTVPYQIACNFDKVMKLAATKRILGPNEYFYFMHDEIISAQAKNCFDEDFRKMLEEDGAPDSDDQDGRMDGCQCGNIYYAKFGLKGCLGGPVWRPETDE